MKPLIAAILFSLFTLPVFAKLGDTEEQIRTKHAKADKTDQAHLDARVKVIVFTGKYGEYAALLIDGIVEVETYAFVDGYPITMEDMAKEMEQYSSLWIDRESPIEGTKSAVSADGYYFVVVGPLKAMRSNRTITIYTLKWKDYGVKLDNL